MDAVLVFALVFSFAAGTVTYALALALYKRQNTRLVRYFMVFLAFLWGQMLCAVVLYLLHVFVADAGWAVPVLNLVSRLTAVCLGVSAVFFIRALLGTLQSRAAAIVILCAGAFLALVTALGSLPTRRPGGTVQYEVFNITDLFIRLFMVVPVVTVAALLRRIKDPAVRGMMRAVLILSACFFPFLVLDEFALTITVSSGGAAAGIEFLSFPLFYLLFNAVLIYHGFKYHIREQGAASSFSLSPMFVQEYGVSDREQDVVKLLSEGYTNREIGQRLFISPATVRNHIHNVLEKTGSRNRIDLLRRAVTPRPGDRTGEAT